VREREGARGSERECVRKAKLRESKSAGERVLAGVSVCVCTSGIDRVDPHELNMGSVAVRCSVL